jgi:hypothetical protein
MTALYGIVAHFDRPERLVAALERLRSEGYERLDAYSPYHIEALDALLSHRSALLPLVVFIAGAVGALFGFFLQYYGLAVGYPVNVGGRPLNSWPAFGPSTYEITVLFALTAAFIGFLAGARLWRLYHPIFAAPEIERATADRFVLFVAADDPRFDRDRLRQILDDEGPSLVADVPR